MATPWWQTGVLYQIYPRSFADGDGDGVGDLRGIIDHLGHLEWLGVDGVWLSPITVSPNADWGYDVADYCDVEPELGTLADVEELLDQAGRRGIRVLLDLVPNHTSDRHRWFVDARSGRQSSHRDWYVWADPAPAGGPPNNWLSAFGGPAWTFDPASGQYYLHNFLSRQPDLNWWNAEVRDAFDAIQRFWFDRGVAGFRIDVAHMIVKDALLRDNPPAREDDPPAVRAHGQRSVYNSNRPEVHDILRRWRTLAQSYEPERLLLGETWVLDLATLASFYGTGRDELHLGFNIPFIHSPFDAQSLRRVVEETESLLPGEAWPVWAGSNHDVSRIASRWAHGDPARARLALLMLLTLRGTPVLYQGDELGLLDTNLRRDQLRDPVGIDGWPDNPGRDPVRTPMPWRSGPGRGFTDPQAQPWLPFPEESAGGPATVADQRGDGGSMLCLARDLISLRGATPDLASGGYGSFDAAPPLWVYRRGESTTVALNMGEEEARLAWPSPGQIAIGTDRRRDHDRVGPMLILRPWEGVVITTV